MNNNSDKLWTDTLKNFICFHCFFIKTYLCNFGQILCSSGKHFIGSSLVFASLFTGSSLATRWFSGSPAATGVLAHCICALVDSWLNQFWRWITDLLVSGFLDFYFSCPVVLLRLFCIPYFCFCWLWWNIYHVPFE